MKAKPSRRSKGVQYNAQEKEIDLTYIRRLSQLNLVEYGFALICMLFQKIGCIVMGVQ